MLFRVADMIEAIAEKLGGGGVSLCNQTGVMAALKMFNRINGILMNRQDWPGTEDDVSFPVFGNIFTLAPRFESIKALTVNDTALPIVPAGFRYLETTPSRMTLCGNYNLQHIGSHFATFRDLPKPLPVFAISDQTETLTITVQGTDAAGRFIRATIPVLAAYPDRAPEHSSVSFRTITAITKPLSKGHTELVAWDDAKGEALWLSTLAPDETTPSLTRYMLPDVDPCNPCHVNARVSASFRKQWDVEEVALIQGPEEAYRLMTQSLTHFDRSETPLGSEFQLRAMKLLKERAAKLAIGQEVGMPRNPNARLPARKGYSIKAFR